MMRDCARRFAAAVLLLASAGEASAQSRSFFCGEDTFLTVQVIDARTITAGLIEGKTLTLTLDPNNPRKFLFGDYGVEFADAEHLKLELPDFGAIDCVYRAAQTNPAPPPAAQAPTAYPREAKSWGGIVRSGPGADFPKVASLKEGEPITLLEQSGAPFFQDRPWFKISFRGRIGYHWGGIICPIGSEIAGTFQVCN